jgi:hypothetical protein
MPKDSEIIEHAAGLCHGDYKATLRKYAAIALKLEAAELFLVPGEPTPKMVDSTWDLDIDGLSHNTRNRRIYEHMLAAAPQFQEE